MEEMNEMTEREAEEYGALLSSAYPQPKDGLKDAVMARISAEKAARRRRRQSFIRWGSIAACLVIIAGAAFAVLPKVMSQKNSGFAKYTFDSAIAEDCVNECEIYDAPSDEGENDMEADHNWYGNFALVPNLASDLFEDGYGAASNGSKELYDREGECASNEMPDIEENAEIADNNARYVNLIITEADFDIDGDGEIEHCTITPGPTSGVFSIWFTVHSQNGDREFRDGFVLDWGSLEFETVDGKMMLKHCEHYHGIEILDGHVSLPTDCEDCMLNGHVEWQNK